MARRAAPVQLSLALEKPTDATSAGYYIYNKVGGGYAIVSADEVTDMIFNPELSREGCLLRENEESDFTDIVIQEDRSFQIDFKGKAKTIQYGLALCYDGQIKEILADTLLDVSNINSSEQRLSFRFSIGSHNHCATYQIRSVSRIHDDDDWAFNDEDDNLGDNYYKAEITRKQLYLHYKNLNFDNLSFNLKTGFGTDEKFVTIDEQGIPSQNLKLRFHYSGEPQVKARYATDGRAVGSGYRGIVVEVDGNGKARKVVRR